MFLTIIIIGVIMVLGYVVISNFLSSDQGQEIQDTTNQVKDTIENVGDTIENVTP